MSANTRQRLAEIVRVQMTGEDEETVRVVTAIAGLLACVAYADRQFVEAEQAQIRSELGRIHGLSGAAVDTICKMLSANIADLACTASHYYLRDIKELADYQTRFEVLDALLSLAAADGSVSTVETNLLRRLSDGLGLSAGDYNALQSRYRDKLSVLK